MADQKQLSLEQIFASSKSKLVHSGDLFSSTRSEGIALHTCIFHTADIIGLPTVVLPARGDMESFFADSATYFPERVPVTALMYVLDDAVYKSLSLSNVKKLSERDSAHRMNAFIGLILGEAMTSSRSSVVRGAVPAYHSCKRTLAYCFGRAAFLYPELHGKKIADRWMHIRKLAGMDSSLDITNAIVFASELINGRVPSDSRIGPLELVEAISRYLLRQIPREEVVVHFVSEYPELKLCVPLLYDSFEKRMEAFGAVVEVVRRGRKNIALATICLSFFCNMIFPGSMAHAGVIEKLLPEHPDAMLWYGLFSGASEEFALASAGGSVGQKILRDLVAPVDLESRPTCDVSLEEYEVISRLSLRSEILKPTQARALLVAIYPGIDVFVRSVTEDEDNSERSSLPTFSVDREVLQQVSQLLKHADRLLNDNLPSEPAIRARPKAPKKAQVRQSKKLT